MIMKTVKIEKTLDAATFNIASVGPTVIDVVNTGSQDWKLSGTNTAYLDTYIDVSGWTSQDKGLVLTNASIRMLNPRLGGGATYAYEWLYVTTAPFLRYVEVNDNIADAQPPSIGEMAEETLCSPNREGPAWSQLMFGKQYGWANNQAAFAAVRAVPFTCVSDGSGAVSVGDKIYIRRVWGQDPAYQVGFSSLSEMRIVLEGALVDMKEYEQVMALQRQSLQLIQADED